MSWNKLAPIVKSTGKPMASASISVDKAGVAKIGLLLSASLRDEFDGPEAADVLAGTGDDFGLVRVEFRADGVFKVGNFVHGGGRIFLPVPEGLPDKPAANAACAVVDKHVFAADAAVAVDDFQWVVLKLPLAEWRREIADRGAAPRPAAGGGAASVAPAPRRPAEADDGKVDVVDYLTKKGLKVSRLAGGRFMLSGQTVLLAEVLGQVNQHRKEARLPPLTSSDVK